MGNAIDFVNNMSEEELLEWFDKEFGMKIEIRENS